MNRKRVRGMWNRGLTCLAAWGISMAVSGFTLSGDAFSQRVSRDDASFLIFTRDGTVTVTKAGTVDVFLVGGGGGGGAGNPNQTLQGGGGGGGGGVLYRQSVSVSAGTYDVKIGAGGAIGENGGNTTAFGLIAYGGGGGANYGGASGKDGASGGGATSRNGETQVGGEAIYGDADNLGHAGCGSSHLYGAGGGGGAGTAATVNTEKVSLPGQGGDGVSCPFFTTRNVYGGGGAGYRSDVSVSGGQGGGGSCLRDVSEPGTDGRGGGGCGGSRGGCGTVIIRFVPTATACFSEDFGMTGGDEVYLSEEESIHIFRKSGTVSVTGSGFVELLAVGGGGGGGAASEKWGWGSGGGGGGGVVHGTNILIVSGTYDVTIGDGGDVSENGGDSVVFGFTAFGGGAGADSGSQTVGKIGDSGGSGGGSTHSYNESNIISGGTAGYLDWGNFGCDGGFSGHVYGSGGGGGAGAPGGGNDGSSSMPGNGGDGLAFSITGETVYYAGGGAGCRADWSDSSAEEKGVTGGKGGGGNLGLPGEDGLGGGGSGMQPGGKGVVVIRYRKSTWYDEFEGATGGTFVKKGRYGIHSFAENGTFTMPCAGKVEVLLVGGGGGGGAVLAEDNKVGGGGGGGGGVVLTNRVLAAGSYAVSVGAGGAISENGGDSSFFGMTAYGGGGGADGTTHPADSSGVSGNDGASGGGATHEFEINDDVEGTAVIVSGGRALYGAVGNLGYAGGYSKHVYAPGGGGGAGAPGGNSIGTIPGAGGDGVPLSFTGSEIYYGGGGAGSRNLTTVTVYGGAGGGGSCIMGVGEPGVDGLGGGGCGGTAGGDGVVVIRYIMPNDGTMLIIR